MQDVGFIGLGMMGAHMARHIANAGFRLHVFDANEDAAKRLSVIGAIVHSSPRSVSDAADAVLVCLPTPDIVEQVALGTDGLIHGRRATLYADHSTTGPTVARKVADQLAKAGIKSLDAPLAGGSRGAEAGTLSVMVSGDEEAFSSLLPVFQSFGRNVKLVGREAGQGQALKLVNNIIVGANLVVAAEAVLLGVKFGLEAETVLQMLNASTARSFVTEDLIEKRILDRNFDFGFRLELMCKDLRLCLAEAEAAGVPMPVSALARSFYDTANENGMTGRDMTVVIDELERAAGVMIARSTN